MRVEWDLIEIYFDSYDKDGIFRKYFWLEKDKKVKINSTVKINIFQKFNQNILVYFRIYYLFKKSLSLFRGFNIGLRNSNMISKADNLLV